VLILRHRALARDILSLARQSHRPRLVMRLLCPTHAQLASLSDSSGLLLLVCVNSYKPELLPMFRFLLSMWANVDTLTTELAKQHMKKMAQTEMLQ